MSVSAKRGCLPAHLRLNHLILIAGGGITLLEGERAEASMPVEFQSTFMRQLDNHSADAGALALRNLSAGQELLPGRYRVGILVNQSFFDQRDIDFASAAQGQGLEPCLSAGLLEEIGVKLDSLAEPQRLESTCIDLARLIPGAVRAFDASTLTLSLSIPQIAMRRDVAGYVDPARWEHGINAAFINYQAALSESNSDQGGHTSNRDLYLNGGLNLGAWRLRSNHSLRQDNQGHNEWSRAYSYAQRDLPGTHSQLTLGETFTPGDVFRSLPIKGVQVASDMGMLPDSLQGYAPIIRGVAQTRAKVEIRQNGYPIYSTYVSPGPFAIDDLNTAGGSGELEIVLTEADGQVRRFTQPYATLGNLLREGVWRYSASVGRYNANTDLDDPLFWQGTLAMGSAWNSTLYGGAMASEYYRAATLGIGKSLGHLGALSFDATRSDADTGHNDQSVQGMSYALKYGKAFATRTNLRFAGYRYSTEGYRDLDEAVRERSHDARFFGSRRSRLEAAVFQPIGINSSLNFSLSQEDYWRSDYQRRQFQFNLNTQHQGVSYNLFASKSLADDRHNDRQVGLSVSIPLHFGRSTNATFDVLENAGRYSQRASLSGNLDNDQLNYRASLANSENQDKTAALSLTYQGAAASVGAGYTQGSDYNSLSLNATGAVLLHGDGIALGPYLGETSGLVHVPDTADVGILNSPAVKTNERGYALLPHLRPYRVNRVVLNTEALGPEVEIDNGVTQLVPRRGAVVKAHFPSRRVQPIVLTAVDAQGRPLPFGAEVSDAEGEVLGLIGQGGQVMFNSTAQGPQTLSIRWGNKDTERCQMTLEPQALPEQAGYRIQQQACRSQQ